MPRPAKPLTLLFDETAHFNEMEWAVFRTYISSPEFTKSDVAERHNLTPQRAGLIYRSVLAEIVRRAERHNAVADLAMLKKNPRRSGKVADAWAEITWKYRNRPAPKLNIEQPPRFWFQRRVADRLEAAGYTSLRHIIEAVNSVGVRWYDSAQQLPAGRVQAVTGIGERQARQLIAWLIARAPLLDVQIEPYAVSARTPAAVTQWRKSGEVRSDVLSREPAPLERLAPDNLLAGRTGRNRAPLMQSQIGADDDLAAIRSWLSQYKEGGNTWLKYRREIERFLAWALFERRKAFSSLTADDCTRYRDWLLDPQPAERWIGPVKPRWHPQWRPFSASLSLSSAKAACVIVRACMSWLVPAGHLLSNPFDIVKLDMLEDGSSQVEVNRSFTKEHIERLRELLDAWTAEMLVGEEAARLARQRFVVLFGISTGVRLAELADLRLN